MDTRTAIELACLLEATARKPGNVHRFRDFADLTYFDFLASAIAIGPSLANARQVGIGQAVFDAVTATRQLVRTNSNLGIILLLAPLALADEGLSSRAIQLALDGMTIDDSKHVFAAIRLANPGGLGTSNEQDVADEPTLTLRAIMTFARARDSIARQYADGYADIFKIGAPALGAALDNGWSLEEAIVACHLQCMAELPDTLIARKRGQEEADLSATMARSTIDVIQQQTTGWIDHPSVRQLDDWLTEVGHQRNPGASADLTTASIYVALRTGLIPAEKLHVALPSAFAR